jgi:hypothetical protein
MDPTPWSLCHSVAQHKCGRVKINGAAAAVVEGNDGVRCSARRRSWTSGGMEGWKLIVTCGKESKIGWEVEKRRLVVRGKVEGMLKCVV